MKMKISHTVMVIVILLINLTLSVQVTRNNNQVLITLAESRAGGNIEVKDSDPGEDPFTNSKTLEEWSLSSIMEEC